MPNRYYQNNEEKLRKEARERYRNISEEEIDKRRKMAREDIKILLKEKKKKSVSIIVINIEIFQKIKDKG